MVSSCLCITSPISRRPKLLAGLARYSLEYRSSEIFPRILVSSLYSRTYSYGIYFPFKYNTSMAWRILADYPVAHLFEATCLPSVGFEAKSLSKANKIASRNRCYTCSRAAEPSSSLPVCHCCHISVDLSRIVLSKTSKGFHIQRSVRSIVYGDEVDFIRNAHSFSIRSVCWICCCTFLGCSQHQR